MLSVTEVAPRRLIPVVVVEDARQAEPIREALKRGGLRCAEITCRTDAAVDTIRVMAEDPDFVVGAGTVTSVEQVAKTVEAGARFVVSPGLSSAVVRACQAADVACVPGAITATEIMAALDLGLTSDKFFPAEVSGGMAAISALSAPFPTVRFVPTGGIRVSSLSSYLSSTAVAAVGGTWLTPLAVQSSGDFREVERLTAEAVAVAEASA